MLIGSCNPISNKLQRANIILATKKVFFGKNLPKTQLKFKKTLSFLLGLRGSKGLAEMIKRDGTVSKQTPVRKLEFSLEDQIYQIYRKARILTGR